LADSCAAVITGCEFTGNVAETAGGALNCRHEATPRVSGCLFEGNTAGSRGGAVVNNDYTHTIYTGCTFVGNEATEGGGTLCCAHSENLFQCCTFQANSSSFAGAHVSCGCSAHTALERCILTFGLDGGSVYIYSDGVLDLSCCDVYGNVGGDWVEAILDQYGILGNFSGDPLFCDAGAGDFTLHQESPCMPGEHPQGAECGIIGAWPVGCPISPVVTEPALPVTFGLTGCAPNPFTHASWITYRLPGPLPEAQAGPVRLQILDAAGRLVRTLTTPPPLAGQHSVRWDGRDERGRQRAAGTFYARLSWKGRTTVRPLSLIR
jgi:hypothetical protein